MNPFALKGKTSNIVIVTGPRSVGKTTLAQTIYRTRSIPYIDLDDVVNASLGTIYNVSHKSPLEQAMDKRDYTTIESIVTDFTKSLINISVPTVIAYSGGAFCGYNGMSALMNEQYITIGLLPYQNNIKKSLSQLLERECKREHFQKLISNGDLTIETLRQQIERDYTKVSTYLLDHNVDSIIFTQNLTPVEIAEMVLKLVI